MAIADRASTWRFANGATAPLPLSAGEHARRPVGGQPWRRAVGGIAGAMPRFGVETDHLTLAQRDSLVDGLGARELVDVAPALMARRTVESVAEIAPIRPAASGGAVGAGLDRFSAAEGPSDDRAFGYGHRFGVPSPYDGREAGLELREDVATGFEPGALVVSMEPRLRVAAGEPGAGGYREHDIPVVTADGAENLTGFAYGPETNVIAA